MNDLMQAVEQILDDGHLTTETLAHLRAAYETAHGEDLYILALERQNRKLRKAASTALDVLAQWDDLIEHQYTGSSAAMTDMHYAAQATVPVMKELREALGESDE